MSNRRLMLVHAHPDDESLATGGTIARYAAEGAEVVVVTCTLDPNSPQAGTLHLDLGALGFGHDERVLAHDLITGQTWAWGRENYIRHDPNFTCAHAVVLERMP